jgi:membrane fusion protein (multidrug efflux system)
MPPPAVLVQTVIEQPVYAGFEFVGRTEAIEDVNIRSRVDGFLLQLHFTEGDVVQKGQLLFDIDPQPYIAGVAQAKAELARSRAQLDVARQNFRRGESLYPRGTISEAQYQELKGKFETGLAVVDAADAAMQATELNLNYTRITAPITGRIGRKTRSIGDLVTPNDTLATLVQQDPVYVTFQVNEKTLISTMETARELKSRGEPPMELVPYLTLSNGSDYEHPGEINFLDNRVDPATGTVTVRTRFPNEEDLLIPGQYVSVHVRNRHPRKAVVVAQRAVQEDQLGRFVLLVDEGDIARTRRVDLGSRIKSNWVVEAGLSEGDQVIVDGIQKVRVGMPVQARQQPAADTAKPIVE